MIDFICCGHMGQLRSVLEQTQEENIRLLVENETLKSENESLVALIQSEIDASRNHEVWYQDDLQEK
jgi:regulator of replication initiation timing